MSGPSEEKFRKAESTGNQLSRPTIPSPARSVAGLRDMFMNYCKEDGYIDIGGASILPRNDPTLLFINSGMAPLKKFFTGEEVPKAVRASNIQLCVRTTDIESIGDASHLTCFEMMGNWTFGSLSKTEALHFALRIVENILQVRAEDLFTTYFSGDVKYPMISRDDEARDIWRDLGLPAAHIVGLGAEDNLWGPPGTCGPMGPCSEMFLDRGNEFGAASLSVNPSRYVEIWNAGVFIEYWMNELGSVSRLKAPSLDAGAGVERWAMFLQNKSSVYEIDSIRPILENFVCSGLDPQSRAARIMTDHIRTSTHLIAEGVRPSNQREGYILRRLVRRAATQAKLHGIGVERLLDAAQSTIEIMSPDYPLLRQYHADIILTLRTECDKFLAQLKGANRKLERLFDASRKTGVIEGVDAFNLVSSVGVPLEIMEALSEKENLVVDRKGFGMALRQHQETSRKQSP